MRYPRLNYSDRSSRIQFPGKRSGFSFNSLLLSLHEQERFSDCTNPSTALRIDRRISRVNELPVRSIGLFILCRSMHLTVQISDDNIYYLRIDNSDMSLHFCKINVPSWPILTNGSIAGRVCWQAFAKLPATWSYERRFLVDIQGAPETRTA